MINEVEDSQLTTTRLVILKKVVEDQINKCEIVRNTNAYVFCEGLIFALAVMEGEDYEPLGEKDDHKYKKE